MAASKAADELSNLRFSDRLIEVALGGLLLGLLAALGIALVRFGFALHLDVIGTALLWLAFMLFLPVALLRRLCTPVDEGLLYAPCYMIAAAVLIALSFLGAAGTAILFCATLMAIFDLRRALAATVRGRFGRWLMLLLAGLLLVLELAGTRYGSFIADIVAQYGRASNDIYYHWSIANALRWYGTVGIGVDGIVPVTYYATVHMVAVRLAEAAGADVGIAFIVLRAVFLVPLMLAGFAAFSLTMDYTGRLRGATGLALIITLALLISVLHVSALDSESFTLGLLLLSWGAVALHALDQDRTTGSRRARWAAWLSIVPLLLAMSLSKSSVGLIFLCLAGYVHLRVNWRRPVMLIGYGALLVAVGGLAVYWVAPRGAAGDTQGSIAENFFVDEDALRPLIIYGSAIASLVLGIVAAGGLREFLRSLQRGQAMRFELMAGCIAAATAPALVFGMVDRGASYFLGAQTWWCFAMSVALLPAAADRIAGWNGKVWHAAGAALYLLPGLLLIVNLGGWLRERGYQVLSASLLIRTQDATYYTDDKKRIVAADVRRGHALFLQRDFWHPASTPTPTGPLMVALADLRRQYGTALAGYASPDDRPFWNMRDSCPGKPMLLFSLTAVPLLDGLPPLWTQCAFNSRAIYGLETLPPRQTDTPLDDRAVCHLATTQGFSVVYRIEDMTDLGRNRLLTCS